MSVGTHGMHWPCLLPQHGPGVEHRRKRELADWQQAIVDGNPQRFLRGLFHSDGSRFTNTVVHNGKRYRCPRYMFVNESNDITELCRRSLDRTTVAWR
jgi:hypothetical protein